MSEKKIEKYYVPKEFLKELMERSMNQSYSENSGLGLETDNTYYHLLALEDKNEEAANSEGINPGTQNSNGEDSKHNDGSVPGEVSRAGFKQY